MLLKPTGKDKEWNKKGVRGKVEVPGEGDDRGWKSPLAWEGTQGVLMHVWPCSTNIASPESRRLPDVPGKHGTIRIKCQPAPHMVQGRSHGLLGSLWVGR